MFGPVEGKVSLQGTLTKQRTQHRQKPSGQLQQAHDGRREAVGASEFFSLMGSEK